MTESHESEISREMIEAGLLHLYRYHPDTGVDDEETVRRIFLAMLDAAERVAELEAEADGKNASDGSLTR